MIERSNMYQIMHTDLEQEMPQKFHENSKNGIHHYFKKSEKKKKHFKSSHFFTNPETKNPALSIC